MNEREYESRLFEEGDGEFVKAKVLEAVESCAPPEPGAEEEKLVLRIMDERRHVAAGCFVHFDKWKIASLSCIWVDRFYHRQGMGSALINAAERAARERGCRLMYLALCDFRKTELGEKLGFTRCGAVENWPQGYSLVVHKKRLNGPFREVKPPRQLRRGVFKLGQASAVEEEIVGTMALRTAREFAPAERERAVESLGRKLVDGEGRLVAGCAAELFDWNELIVKLWVDEARRGRGLGSRLLAETEREAKEKGCRCALLEAYDRDVDFYRKHGYAVCVECGEAPPAPRSYLMKKAF